MFLFLNLLVICSAVTISFLYFNQVKHPKRSNQKIILLLWLLIFVATVLICSNLARVGLVFNPQAPDYDFMQTIDSNYIGLFIVDLVYIVIGILVYFFVTRKLKVAPLWFLVALLLLVVYMYYPGIPSADGIDTSYTQYLAHSYTDFQPPLFTIWWNIFHVKSAAFIMNSLLYYGGLIYISYFLQQNKKHWQNDVLVLFCLNPLLFTQLAIIWKDISFTGFLIDAVAIHLAISQLKNKKLILGLWFIYFSVLFLAIGFRFNGAIAVLPLMFFGVYKILETCFSKSRVLKVLYSGLISLGITCIFFAVNWFIAYHVFDAKPTRVQGGQMLSNIASVECISDHQYQIAAKYFSPPTDDSRYVFCNQVINYYNNDAFFFNWSGTGVMLTWDQTDAGYRELKQEWQNVLIEHPLFFMQYRAEYFINVLFFNYWYPTGTLTSSPDWLSQIAAHQHADMKIELALFLIAGTISMLFLCIYFQIYGLSFIIILSSLLQLLSLYLLIPNHSARYFFWDYIAVILAMVLLTFDRKIIVPSEPEPQINKKKRENSEKI